MTHAIVIDHTGGPETLVWQAVEVAAPAPHEVRVKHSSIGVNYIDTYMRSGLYSVPMPAIIGQQGVGIITALGTNVTRFKLGDRVAYGSAPIGAYAEERVVPVDCLVAMPEGLSDDLCAANLLRGMTAEYLLFRMIRPITAGDFVLVHAASGGTGFLLAQWARALGARVIGSVGGASREALAHAAGCELVLRYDDPDFVEKVRQFTQDALCDVVFDSVGKDTFSVSLACVKVRGLLAAYGNGSGKPDPLDVLQLAAQGSIFLTRPRLDHYARSVVETEQCAARFFDVLLSGTVTPREVTRFALKNAAAAHRHLENREALTTPVLFVE